jgi:hypothetical protein
VARLGSYIPLPGTPRGAGLVMNQNGGGMSTSSTPCRVARSHGGLRPGHHVSHFRLDHYSADDDGVSGTGSAEEERGGAQVLNQYTRYFTARWRDPLRHRGGLEHFGGQSHIVTILTFFRINAVITLTGAPLLMGSADHQRGVGNGIS